MDLIQSRVIFALGFPHFSRAEVFRRELNEKIIDTNDGRNNTQLTFARWNFRIYYLVLRIGKTRNARITTSRLVLKILRMNGNARRSKITKQSKLLIAR